MAAVHYIIIEYYAIHILLLNKFGKRYTNKKDMYSHAHICTFSLITCGSCSTDKARKSVKWPVDDQEHKELLERSQAR